MAVAYYGRSTAVAYSSSGGSSVAPSYPDYFVAGGRLLLFVAQKPSTANGGTVSTPSGWTLVGSITGAGGYGGTLGADTGNTNLFVFEKIATGYESGTLAVTVGTNGVCAAWMVSVIKDFTFTVGANSSTYACSGVDVYRGADQLIVFTQDVVTSPANTSGTEVAVVDGVVTAVDDRQSTGNPGMAVPVGGYVLSGHGAARTWLLANCTVGMAVTGIPAGLLWTTSVAATGSQTSQPSTSLSVATGNIEIAAGDCVVAAFGTPTDVTTPSQYSSETFAQSGTTFGTIWEGAEWDSTTGDDLGGVYAFGSVTSGGGVGSFTFGATVGGTRTNVRGPLIVVRARASAASASVTGAGAVTADASVLPGGVTGTASVAGAGAVSAQASVIVPGSASVAGAGSVSANAKQIIRATSAPAGVGAVSASGTVRVPGTASVAGVGAATAAASVIVPGTASIAGQGSVTAVGTAGGSATATVAGTGSTSAAATVIAGGMAAGAGSTSAKATLVTGSAVAGSGAVTAAGSEATVITATASVLGVGLVTAVGTKLVLVVATASVRGAGIVDVAPVTVRAGALSAGAGAVTARHSPVQREGAQVCGLGQTTARATVYRPMVRFTVPAVPDGPAWGLSGLAKFYDRPRSVSVLITGSSYRLVESPNQAEIAAADAFYGGGREYLLTPAEAAVVAAAGLPVGDYVLDPLPA